MAKTSKPFQLEEPAPVFEGFPREAIRFLQGLKKNNNKLWFEEHRDDYEMYLRAPSKALVHAMSQFFRAHHMTVSATPKASLFRINRDIRFSKDKSPYKTHVGLWFPFAETKKDEWCGYYIGIEPTGARGVKAFAAGGVYAPGSAQLKRLRARLAEDHKAFRKLLTDDDFLDAFPTGLTGESLKRMPLGFKEEHPAAYLLKHKDFLFRAELAEKDLLEESLPERLGNLFLAAWPVLKYLGKV